MKLFLLLVNIFALSACAVINKPDYYYNEVVLRNNSLNSVTSVRIKVDKTQAVFSCSIILPNTACTNKFPKRKYLGNQIQITWTYLNTTKTTEKFNLKLPKEFDESIPLRGILEVTQDGMVIAFLEPGKIRDAKQ